MSIKKINVNGTQHDLIASSAAKLVTARNIDGVSFDGSANVTRYATCTTAAGTSAKIATTTSGTFKLDIGARVTVKFTNALSASGVSLNVNNTGAKTIHCGDADGGTYLHSDKYWEAGSVIDFVYDGTYWNMATTGYAVNAGKASCDGLGNSIVWTYALKNQTGNCYCIDNSSVDELDIIIDHYDLTTKTSYVANENYPVEPKAGDIILDIKGNAVYRFYPYSNSSVATVYVYRKVRNNEQLVGGGEVIGEVIGNFAGINSNTVLFGSNADIGNQNLGADDCRWFKNRGLALIDTFTMTNPFSSDTSLPEAVKNRLGTSDDALNDTLVIVDLVVKPSSSYPASAQVSANHVDNGCAIFLCDHALNKKEKFAEYWSADCWYEDTATNLPRPSGTTGILGTDANHLRVYYFEQYGGHYLNLRCGDVDFSTATAIQKPSSNLTGKGQWVYVGQINEEISYTRNFEANETEPTKTSNNTNLSYTTLVPFAKPGDIYVKTPTSAITAITNTQVWTCKYSDGKKNGKQVWDKKF